MLLIAASSFFLAAAPVSAAELEDLDTEVSATEETCEPLVVGEEEVLDSQVVFDASVEDSENPDLVSEEE